MPCCVVSVAGAHLCQPGATELRQAGLDFGRDQAHRIAILNELRYDSDVGIEWIILALLLQGGEGQWKRHFDVLDMGNGDKFAFPPARPMPYFLVDRCLRADPADRFQCSARPTRDEQESARRGWAELRFIGHVGAFSVYDLFHFNASLPGPYLRSVLLSESSDRVHEVYVQGGFASGEYFPTRIFKAGDQTILHTAYDEQARYSPLWERYFVVTGKGTTALDFKKVLDAARKVAPDGKDIFEKTQEFDWTKMVYQVQVMPKGGVPVECCDGRVEVPFSLTDGSVTAGPAKYFPE